MFYSLAALVRKILFCHWKIKFISSRHRVISCIYFPIFRKARPSFFRVLRRKYSLNITPIGLNIIPVYLNITLVNSLNVTQVSLNNVPFSLLSMPDMVTESTVCNLPLLFCSLHFRPSAFVSYPW